MCRNTTLLWKKFDFYVNFFANQYMNVFTHKMKHNCNLTLNNRNLLNLYCTV